jgi:hypothetical protein
MVPTLSRASAFAQNNVISKKTTIAKPKKKASSAMRTFAGVAGVSSSAAALQLYLRALMLPFLL